ncbi:MAG: LLM class flavin-dependent oxidoreductase [Candidatus Rokubacteria bacterium]|nr:LLM class flavin-dependent oxidoreductase [Candidatus Rokubacteria bacterium]
MRARIAFYASTRTYKSVFDAHGWGGVVDELHGLSTRQRWEEMPKYVSDEVLETIAVVGTYDEVAGKLKKRYGDFATRVEFSLPVRRPADRDRLRAVIRELREG